jgi:putative nucleotidyltransferase with HDIG domain
VFIFLDQKHLHYLRAGDSISAQKLQKFENQAPEQFYVLADQRAAFKKYVHGRLRSEQVHSREKALILRESSLSLVEELFENPEVGAALEESKSMVDEFVTFMDHEPEGMAHLISLSSHDFYTYTHSLDVAIYSLGLGRTVGFQADELRQLGQGSLFHDIGKKQVAASIICKDGPLDDIEWAQMQKHPEYGLQILAQQDVSDEVKACAFEHHESWTGNGYPQKLLGEEIHPMARIVALTDTYDALTTQRSYNKPMMPKDALDFMKHKIKGKYDPDLLRAMYEVLFRAGLS